jgi:hypothetical protein
LGPAEGKEKAVFSLNFRAGPPLATGLTIADYMLRLRQESSSQDESADLNPEIRNGSFLHFRERGMVYHPSFQRPKRFVSPLPPSASNLPQLFSLSRTRGGFLSKDKWEPWPEFLQSKVGCFNGKAAFRPFTGMWCRI